MTEAEWFACIAPHELLYFLDELGAANDRKMRLFACECVRRYWHVLPSQCLERKAVELIEGGVDGLSTRREIQQVQAKLLQLSRDLGPKWTPFSGAVLELIDRPRAVLGCRRATEIADMVAWGSGGALNFYNCDEARSRAIAAEGCRQVALIRDIFGNPFRPVPFNSDWRTSGAISLAQSIYDERAFNRLPILSDALEDAGCANVDIFDHCRQPADHVRGCWVVDLVLGKI